MRAQPDLSGPVHVQTATELPVGFRFRACSQTAVELAMNFWNGIAPLGLALAVRSGSVGADSEEKLAEGRRKEGEEEGGEGAAPSSKSRNPAIGGKKFCHGASCFPDSFHRTLLHRCVPNDLCRAPCLQSTGLAQQKQVFHCFLCFPGGHKDSNLKPMIGGQ